MVTPVVFSISKSTLGEDVPKSAQKFFKQLSKSYDFETGEFSKFGGLRAKAAGRSMYKDFMSKSEAYGVKTDKELLKEFKASCIWYLP